MRQRTMAVISATVQMFGTAVGSGELQVLGAILSLWASLMPPDKPA